MSAFFGANFGFDGGLFALELLLTAVAFDGFIVLLSHMILYFIR
ncbi:MAG TPA: hypothetical protein VFF11_01815 [Candidatus Binatia bacterium]|nr:hypothetical protein [Candidatus Binatia bacterium]